MPAALYGLAAAVLVAAVMIVFSAGGEESDAYKDGYDAGIENYVADADVDECEINSLSSLSVGERKASPQEREDYEAGCRDGYNDAEDEDD